ncbi:phosphodiester glycosidase family protein [Alicyclobacillus acidocaldarius]|uniref:N-acetylglucosamine-1-phosphodiester alpha-N-acetylglucosaminidase-like protein exopolysaccharide biosynthesis protein n=1 Tax=Alicyclobacillus acidocaldarius subsp. acidocaldarius (strain ATCC 27009 / DSM 446 / BCRC 14685 / JCM 5260 / KCTC 1825 / NBRC 15652 / NCIMB 11725 / NRRL B-14509 / 104-IA) TaxID=521098 RepID=C8WU56_ALIAD|nr:phosphodiester glycosidase family protein [Alicyclobacillus acidocaldarius]ACV57819.1 N-acetylglucosamine-1-phosphodiester alpha-N- acetylglucosaminidase-like protein exopolysaccharide biosynthesis protein [Alicyclobacillus acidocaldarius subsp. acidocaldarius DSM 446]
MIARKRAAALAAVMYLALVACVASFVYRWNVPKPVERDRVVRVASPARPLPRLDAPVFGAPLYRPPKPPSGMRLSVIHEPNFTAYVLWVRDPRRVEIVETRYAGDVGETVEQFVNDWHAVAGVNGGSFTDTNWQGTGGLVQGIVISNGRILKRASGPESIVGFTADGRLISGTYTLAELQAMGVTQALMFGPTLVDRGVDQIQGAGDWGYAPRTAIGQTADGTVILMVTDGRELHGPADIGASLGDIARLMISLGAVTAANLDGGSSATLVYDGCLINQPTDILGERYIGTAVIVK